MANLTKVEWATHTLNWISGCSRVGPECEGCYAVSMSRRLAAMGRAHYQGLVAEDDWTGVVRVDRARMIAGFETLNAAQKQRRVFLNSMADIGHTVVPDEHQDEMCELLQRMPGRHVAMLLSKRPIRMEAMVNRNFAQGLPDNVWIGTSAGTHRTVEVLGRQLSRVPAKVRFLSAEPLLEDITPALAELLPALSWVILGGESGHGARPMHPAWAERVVELCEHQGVPVFFKQWGEWAPADAVEANGTDWPTMAEDPDAGGAPRHTWPDAPVRALATSSGQELDSAPLDTDTTVFRVGKKAAGHLLNGRKVQQFPRELQ